MYFNGPIVKLDEIDFKHFACNQVIPCGTLIRTIFSNEKCSLRVLSYKISLHLILHKRKFDVREINH